MDLILTVDLVASNGRGLFLIFCEVVDLMVVVCLNRGLVVFNYFGGH